MVFSDSSIVASVAFHDAELMAFKVVPQLDGFVTFEADIRIHSDESLEHHFKVDWRNVRLSLDKCWLIKADVIGWGSGGQTIDDWCVKSDSNEIQHLRSLGLAEGARLAHHAIAFISGSRFDIIASGSLSIANLDGDHAKPAGALQQP